LLWRLLFHHLLQQQQLLQLVVEAGSKLRKVVATWFDDDPQNLNQNISPIFYEF
jgi:hypothetical protein